MLLIFWSSSLLLSFLAQQVAATATTSTPAPRPTLRLWEGFDIQLPNIQDITELRNNIDNAAADVTKFGDDRLKEFENGPIGQAGKRAVAGASKFAQEKINEFEKTGIPESVGKWVETAASNTAKFAAQRAKEFDESPLGAESKKVVAHVGLFANDRIKEFEQTGIPKDVVSWFGTAGKDINHKATEFKESEIPQEVLKWIREHPEEMETAGWVLKKGAWIFMFANPGFIWSPVLNFLGWGAKGPVLGSMAAGIQKGMKVVPGGSLFSAAQRAAMGGPAAILDWGTRIGVGAGWAANHAADNKEREERRKKEL